MEKKIIINTYDGTLKTTNGQNKKIYNIISQHMYEKNKKTKKLVKNISEKETKENENVWLAESDSVYI